MAFLGLRGTGDFATNERPQNFREYILWRNPNGSAALTALLAKSRTESTNDPQFHWWEEENTIIRVVLNGAIADGVTTAFTLASGGNNLVPGDLLLVESGDTGNEEIVEVSSVTSDTAITVIRGAAGTTAAAIADATGLLKIGNAYAEGTVSPSVSARNPTGLTNYCQIFKTAYELTKTAEKTHTRTGDPLSNDKKRKMFDHSVALEHSLLYGMPSEVVGSNGKPKRTTGGLRYFIQTNRTVFTAAITQDSFINAVAPVFDFDTNAGNERLCLCGNGALTALNKLAAAQGQVKFAEVVKLYGMALQRWVMPQGSLLLRTHPLMNVHPTFTNSMFVIDPSSIIVRALRDTRSMDNIQANDEDTHKGQWLSEIGYEVHHERAMAYLGNVTYP